MKHLHEMKWLSTELPKSIAGKFKEYCRDKHITYEASECFNLLKFEVFVNKKQAEGADDYIDLLISIKQIEEGKVVVKTMDELKEME